MRDAAGPGLLRALSSRVSIRASLVILLTVALAMLLADRGREAARMRAQEIKTTQAYLGSTARDGARRQESLLSKAKLILSLTAELPATQATSGPACHDALKLITDETPWLVGLAVFDVDGYQRCTDRDVLATHGVADRAYFQRALATHDFALGDYIIGRQSGRPLVVLSYPLLKDGVVQAVYTAGIDLNWMGQLVAETGSELGAEVLLLDRAATVLAAFSEQNGWVGRKLEGQHDFLAALESGATTASLDGVKRVIGEAQLPDSDATVVVMLPLSEVVGEANRLALSQFAKIVIGGAVLFFVIWLGTEVLVVRPIQTLADGAARLGSGDLSARILTQGLAPELRKLGESFNRMAEQLQDRESELRRANRLLADLASKDPLTGVPNRRAFDEHIDAEWRRAGRERRELALLAIDVDYFKKFNDLYGHAAGDKCLRCIAEVLKGFTRRGGDFAARIGGEEFALLLPGADIESAAHTAERIRAAVEALAIEHAGSPLGRVTISAGAAARLAGNRVAPATESRLRFFDLADVALYRAKQSGRNCVSADQPEVSLAS